MLKIIVKYLIIAVIAEVVLFAFISVFIIDNKFFYNPYINDINGTSKYTKILFKFIFGKVRTVAKYEPPALNNSEPGADYKQKTISASMIKEQKPLAPPVWIEENRYCRMGGAFVSVKVSNINTGNNAFARIEIRNADGRNIVFDNVKKGEKRAIGGKYYVELLDVKNGYNDLLPAGGNRAKIALYEKTGAPNIRQSIQ